MILPSSGLAAYRGLGLFGLEVPLGRKTPDVPTGETRNFPTSRNGLEDGCPFPPSNGHTIAQSCGDEKQAKGGLHLELVQVDARTLPLRERQDEPQYTVKPHRSKS
jgi:hypothetical protein